jgi:hypothetical protein
MSPAWNHVTAPLRGGVVAVASHGNALRTAMVPPAEAQQDE